MNDELNEFEQSIKREIQAFLKPGQASKPGLGSADKARPAQQRPQSAADKPKAEAYRTGHLVRLAVRTRQLEADTVFEHRSASISKLEAQLEAEKAAKQAGYPIIGYMIDIQTL